MEVKMKTILVTGSSGGLGSELLPKLVMAGFSVRATSRHRPGHPTISWLPSDMESGQGLAQAVAGVDTILHAASSPFRKVKEIDVEGTQRLLSLAQAAGVSHFIYVSIVGIDQVPLAYYRQKLAAEQLIQKGPLPWTIVRATQFHTLIDYFLATLTRFPLAFLPADFKFQPIDTGEVADYLAVTAGRDPSYQIENIGGPEVLELGQMAGRWLAVRQLRRWMLPMPLPGKIGAAYRSGRNTIPEQPYGQLTWDHWLQRRYGQAR